MLIERDSNQRSMKWIDIRVSKEESNAIEEVVTNLDVPYSRSGVETESGPAVSYSVQLPDEMLDDILTHFSNRIDTRKKVNMLVVHEVTASISPTLQRMQEKARNLRSPSNPLEAITQRLDKYLRPSLEVLIMTLLATVVALAGLFLNNVAVIIGGMLISPLVGPINAASVNASLGRIRQLFGVELSLLLLLGTSIIASALVAYAGSHFIPLGFTNEILSRSSVSVLDVVIALVLGVAAGLALVTDLPEALVGVAVAVALVPPAAVSGIGLALGQTSVFVGALLLVLTSLYGLNAGGVMLLMLKGVTPRKYYEKAQARKYGIYALMAFLAILILLVSSIVASHRAL